MNESPAPSVRAEPAWPAEDEHREGSVHQPWRAVVALVELVFAAAAGWATTWAWSHAVTAITFHTPDGAGLTSRLFSAPWAAAAIGFGLLAALLLVDAFREVILALRTRRKG